MCFIFLEKCLKHALKTLSFNDSFQLKKCDFRMHKKVNFISLDGLFAFFVIPSTMGARKQFMLDKPRHGCRY